MFRSFVSHAVCEHVMHRSGYSATWSEFKWAAHNLYTSNGRIAKKPPHSIRFYLFIYLFITTFVYHFRFTFRCCCCCHRCVIAVRDLQIVFIIIHFIYTFRCEWKTMKRSYRKAYMERRNGKETDKKITTTKRTNPKKYRREWFQQILWECFARL